MKPISRFLLVIVLSSQLFGCDRPECRNMNPVFDRYKPGEKAYNDELLLSIDKLDANNLRYWFREYREINGQEEICFYIQGDGLCAEMVMKVNDWSQLEALRKVKGNTYHGAEFTGLKYDIIGDSSNTEFIFKSYTSIID